MPETVLVLYDRCRLTLKLPIYFDEAGMEQVRKVFKLIRDRPWQNDNTHETLDQFFPAWERDLKDRLEQTTARLTAAKLDAEAKRRTVAAMGSVFEENIKQAQARLAHARKRAKKNPDEVQEYKDALQRAKKPKTDHENAVKEVKSLELAVKRTKAAIERGGKITILYKAIRQSNN